MKHSKIKKLKPTNFSDSTETSKKAQKKSKERFQKEKHKWRNFNSSTFAIGVNMTSNKTEPKDSKKDISGIRYYNYNKKSYNTWTCSKFKKDNAPKN